MVCRALIANCHLIANSNGCPAIRVIAVDVDFVGMTRSGATP
jgi:hypothetical protein